MKLYPLIAIVLVISGCQNEYYVETYKTVDEIAAADEEVLRSRYSTIALADLEISLEWFTYDNPVINKSPYKLQVRSTPKTDSFKSLHIEEVTLLSSQETIYEVMADSWPVILKNDGKEDTYYTFEPAFSFDFHAEEQIKTVLKISIVTDNGTVEDEIISTWAPITVKHFAPVI